MGAAPPPLRRLPCARPPVGRVSPAGDMGRGRSPVSVPPIAARSVGGVCYSPGVRGRLPPVGCACRQLAGFAPDCHPDTLSAKPHSVVIVGLPLPAGRSQFRERNKIGPPSRSSLVRGGAAAPIASPRAPSLEQQTGYRSTPGSRPSLALGFVRVRQAAVCACLSVGIRVLRPPDARQPAGSGRDHGLALPGLLRKFRPAAACLGAPPMGLLSVRAPVCVILTPPAKLVALR